MHQIIADNVPLAYDEALNKMRVLGKDENTRNGPVLAIPDPVVLTIWHPNERVLTDGVRNANPFFHVMETVWMFAGRKDAKWISYYNSRMEEYADDDGMINGAYGHRWNYHFGFSQIDLVISLLRTDPTTRQAVIAMWDPVFDNQTTNDRPCNTTIYFRYVDNALDMTVCNRSNDLIWGMLGANAVHLTYLHELIAHCSGMALGTYRVFCNNLHIYKDLPNYKEIMKVYSSDNVYKRATPLPLLHGQETWYQLHNDCKNLVEDKMIMPVTRWARGVAMPIMDAYHNRKDGVSDGSTSIAMIESQDWRAACNEWVVRKHTHLV